jgi:hypothetical protein
MIMTRHCLHALLLTSDQSLKAHFMDASKGLGIEFRSSGDSEEVCSQFQHGRYEAIVVDLETIPAMMPVFERIKKTSANQQAVIFAITSNSCHRDYALHSGAHFVISRPIQHDNVRETLATAYDLMYCERRRYFRCAVDLPALVKRDCSGEELRCTTRNLSSDGVALTTPLPLGLAETVQIAISLPDGFVVYGAGIVIWDDKHGQCGLRLCCKGPTIREHLDSWLDSQFSETMR